MEMGSGGGERGSPGAGGGGGRAEAAQADSSLSVWDLGGTCPARGLNTRRRLGPRESPARVPTPVEDCDRSFGFGGNRRGG